MVQFLSLDDVLEPHAEQIAAYGGADGIRDGGLLESALAQPAAIFGGKYLLLPVSAQSGAGTKRRLHNRKAVDLTHE